MLIAIVYTKGSGAVSNKSLFGRGIRLEAHELSISYDLT